jgi:hypothetical protein
VRPRDTQRERVYRAERAAAAEIDGQFWHQTIPNQRLQGFVDDVLTRKAIQSRWGRRYIDVGLKRGGRALAHGSSRITLPLGGRNQWVVLHEIAHCLTPDRYAPHGPEFAGVYLFLVRTVIGADAGKALLKHQRKQRVRRSTAAIPEPSRTVVTKTERVQRERTAASRPGTPDERRAAAALIRREVKAGRFGPPGRKPRTHALATARALET